MGKSVYIFCIIMIGIFGVITMNHLGLFDEPKSEIASSEPYLIREWYEVSESNYKLENGTMVERYVISHCEMWSSDDYFPSTSCGWSRDSSDYPRELSIDAFEKPRILNFESKYSLEDLENSDPTIHEKLDDIMYMEYINGLRSARDVRDEHHSMYNPTSEITLQMNGYYLLCYYDVDFDRVNGTDTNFSASLRECGKIK